MKQVQDLFLRLFGTLFLNLFLKDSADVVPNRVPHCFPLFDSHLAHLLEEQLQALILQ